ncbi:MAG: hypothetical protein KJ587_16370 [Alphaproteobacteria bacterium]|nr:hypothetical protein [Alphaproteobacteria bacterium]
MAASNGAVKIGHGTKPQLGGQLADTFVLEIAHAATSSNASYVDSGC